MPIDKKVFSGYEALWVFLVFICLAVYAMGANPLKGETVAPMDILFEFPGWSAVQPDHKAVFLERGDVLDSILPVWITLKEQIRNGKGSLWYSTVGGGRPVFLDLYDPSFWLFVLIKDNALAFYIIGLCKLVAAGTGGYLLARTFAGRAGSLWCGSVFMLCGFNAGWFFWGQVTTAIWIPWLLRAAVVYLKTDDALRLPAVTLAALLMILGGFPSVAAFGFYSFALLVVLWLSYGAVADKGRYFSNSAFFRQDAKKALLLLIATGIAFAMSAVSLVSLADEMRGVNLGYRTGGTFFELRDLLLFLYNAKDPLVEKTAFMGAPAVLLAFVGIVPALRSEDEQKKKFLFCILLLFIAALLITFGLLPHGLIRLIPAFNFNLWGRLIVVPMLCIAVMSAFGLEWCIERGPGLISGRMSLSAANAGRITMIAVIAVSFFQFHLQKSLFNRYNAVVPSSAFYPVTGSIKYVKEHLKPLQSVIADDSFMAAGTLGAYGIPEWYAHSFRTDAEKAVLNSLVPNAAASATSMYINAGDIQFGSPLMDRLAVKYLLIKKDIISPRTAVSLPEISQGLLPPLPDNSWRQHIDLLNDTSLDAVGFLFSTFGAKYAPADVGLTVYDDRGGPALASVEVKKERITDNSLVYFGFPWNLHLKKGGYFMTLSLLGYKGPGKLTALDTANQGNTGIYLELNGLKYERSIQFKMVLREDRDLSFLAGKWNIIELEKNVVVLENKQVTGGAYFAGRIDASGDPIDFSGLDVRQPSSGLVTISYSNGNAGWIVLPMHLHNGWKAYVGNRPTEYSAYMGILPAIPVAGPCEIVFRYEPESVRGGAVLSLAGIAVYSIFIIICRRKGNRRMLTGSYKKELS